jgi:hypothetical protein
MLKPSKHLDLSRSPIRVASEMIINLKRRRIMSYAELMKIIEKRIGDSGDSVVLPALNLCYALGLVEYHVKNDTFEYTGGLARDAA